MKRKMISVSTVLALMLSVAGCKDKAPEETTPETTTPTTAIEASSAEACSAPTAETEPDSQEYPGTTEVPQTASETAEPKTIFRTLPLSAKPEVLQAESGTDIVLRVDFAEADDTYYRWQCRKGTDPWEDSYWEGSGTDSITIHLVDRFDGYLFRCSFKDNSGNMQYSTPVYLTTQAGVPLTDDFFTSAPYLQKISRFDLDGNGSLSQSECSQVKELSLPAQIYYYGDNYTVSPFDDLTGIEYFENLEKLICPGNSLKKLDLHHFPNLQYLDCSGNQLSDLDVSNNPKLTELYCEKNLLTNLDLSQNPALKNLSCSQNQLNSLDLSQNQNLELVNVVANTLTELNISGLKELRALECWNNPLTVIALSECTSLKYFSVDSTASVNGMPESVSITRHYEPSVLKDGYYCTGLSDSGRVLDISPSPNHYTQPLFSDAKADQGMISIEGWLSEDTSSMEQWLDERTAQKLQDLGTDYLSHFLCYKNVSLPLANEVIYQYINDSNEKSVYRASDFNTFMNEMKAIKENYDTEETNGDLRMMIHLSGGAVDEITIDVFMYP